MRWINGAFPILTAAALTMLLPSSANAQAVLSNGGNSDGAISVAGENDTTVTTRSGTSFDAGAVHYDPKNDLAILRVPGLDLPPLSIAPRAPSGTPAAVLGYPENGPFATSPARIGSTGTAISQDSYGRGPIEREMTPLRGHVRSGNSGGPAVGGAGQVMTTVFAAQEGKGPPGGLGVPNSVVRMALGGHLRPTGTGSCSA